MTRPVIVIGGGGHAAVVIDVLRHAKRDILGIADPAISGDRNGAHGVPLLGGDDAVLHCAPDTVELVNGIGSTRSTRTRAMVFERFKSEGYSFMSLIHPGAILAADLRLGEGAQVMAGAVLQPGVELGDNTIVNTRASLDHHCRIGRNVHVAPGATLCGAVTVEDDVHIGSGAVAIQSVRIGRGALVAAGAAVTEDVPAEAVVRPPAARLERPKP